jgi:hypothetical protein
MLADLDIVNPYFCSREQKGPLEAAGVRVIESTVGQGDLPALNPAIFSLLEPGVCGVMDIGGDPAGAHVLGRFAQKIRQIEHEFLCVLNFNRPETATPEKAERYLREIEHSAQLSATGLINNTHLCGETTVEDVLRGEKLAQAVAASAGIPILYNAFPRRLTGKVGLPEETLFPMDLMMKKPWEDETEPTKEEMLCQET